MLQEKLKEAISVDSTNGCWNWTKAKNKDGYGYIWHQGKMHRASRTAFKTFIGPIPEGGLVLHKCDNRACINPDHLFLGTHQDNANDRNKKQRQVHGERHPNAKLSADQVRHYKQLREAASFFIGTRKATQLARQLSGISKTTADHIDSGRRWKHETH